MNVKNNSVKNSKSAKYILTTEIQFNPSKADKFINLWKNIRTHKNKKLFFNPENSSFLELTAITHLDTLPEIISNTTKLFENKEICQFFHSDIHQELLEYKQDIIAASGFLPESKFLQMRHIEVPLRIYDEYLNWREETIFNYVKNLNTIDSFTAYHSLLSNLPGVMFICGFSCPRHEYEKLFSTDAYQEIVRQASAKYISGGKQGLYTKFYELIS